MSVTRRTFLKKFIIATGGTALGAYTINDIITGNNRYGLRVGFYNDAPANLWKWSKKALWQSSVGGMVECSLCPHQCILAENDRGFCRTRVVKNNQLYTVAYGNPCALHIDPIEKKPLYHFLPGTGILSLATAGCNLRCSNCQNWEISQSRPGETTNMDLMPQKVVELTKAKKLTSIAYTYSEPIIFYEYVEDTALVAKNNNVKNVLVTAGYINESPLKQLCKSIDAANVDLKSFSNSFYKKMTNAQLAPVLKGLEIMRQNDVWIEITRLVVPHHSDDLKDIEQMCKWIVENLGRDVPLHFSRFHPAYNLRYLPSTPIPLLEEAYRVAKVAGLHFVYVGNVPGSDYQDTICPKCKTHVIKRNGYSIQNNLLQGGKCSCGEQIPGVWI
ncbi:MAG: AmmeMemoRadiSam system radical SAM enzyme [Bacteriovoracaceae bacterium]|nr:AmmeMemoRadiSam system radical SAM enzyme [Bacteriovoracaceae bacterium]